MNNYNNHPITNFTAIARKHADPYSTISFSKYVYIPQSLTDTRTYLSVYLKDLNTDWLDNQLNDLKSNEELAVHSIIQNRSLGHIPMLDCLSNSIDVIKYKLESIKELYPNYYIYDSGRSYHIYFDDLVLDIPSFFGALIVQCTEIVDIRWIGHRLISGYASLRWSCNTKQYKKYPSLVL
jgi:hypothetical protein